MCSFKPLLHLLDQSETDRRYVTVASAQDTRKQNACDTYDKTRPIESVGFERSNRILAGRVYEHRLDYPQIVIERYYGIDSRYEHQHVIPFGGR